MRLGLGAVVLVGLMSVTRLVSAEPPDVLHEPVSGHQQDLVNPPLDYNLYNPAAEYGRWPNGSPWYSSAALSEMQANTCCVGLWDGYCNEPHYFGKCNGGSGQGLFCGGCRGARRFFGGMRNRSCCCGRRSCGEAPSCSVAGCASCGDLELRHSSEAVEVPQVQEQPMPPPEQPQYDAQQTSPYRTVSHNQVTFTRGSSRRHRSSR